MIQFNSFSGYLRDVIDWLLVLVMVICFKSFPIRCCSKNQFFAIRKFVDDWETDWCMLFSLFQWHKMIVMYLLYLLFVESSMLYSPYLGFFTNSHMLLSFFNFNSFKFIYGLFFEIYDIIICTSCIIHSFRLLRIQKWMTITTI